MHSRTESRHWSWNAAEEVNSLKRALPHGRIKRLPKFDGKWVYEFIPRDTRTRAAMHPCDRVSVKQGKRVAGRQIDAEIRSERVAIID